MKNFNNYLDSSKSAEKNLDYTQMIHYALLANNEALLMKSNVNQAIALQKAGQGAYNLNEMQRSVSYFLRAYSAAKLSYDSSVISDVSVDLAYTYIVNGRPDSALYFAYHSLNYYKDKQNNALNTAWCYRILGDIQYTLSNYDEAKKFYFQGASILKQNSIQDSVILRELSIQISNIAMTLAEENQIKESYKFYKQSDSIALICHAADLLIANKYGMSYTYIYAGEYKKAIALSKEALHYYESINDLYYLEACWESLGRAYTLSGELDSAEYYLKKAEISITQNNNFDFNKEVYSMLSLLYEKKGDAQKSLAYHKLFKAQSDSLFSKNRMYQIDVLQAYHNLKEAEEKNILLSENKAQDKALISAQKKTNILITIALALSLLSAASLGFLYYNKKNQSKKLEKEVSKQTAELNAANTSLKEANAELEEFAHISFHDLREPLRNINSFTTLIKRKGKNISEQELEDFTSIIAFNTKQMKLLVYDVFEFVNVSAEKKEISSFSPGELVDDIIKLFDKSIKEKSVVINKEIEIENIKSHKGLLSVALRNLLENAIKYNVSDKPEINISMHNGNDQYTWYIKDNGIGIDPKYQTSIFEMFKRLHNREKFQGSGLGLSITKKIIDKLDGRIGVISEEGKGSTFWFSIPR